MTDITAQLAEALEKFTIARTYLTVERGMVLLKVSNENMVDAMLALSAYRAQPQPVGEDVENVIKGLNEWCFVISGGGASLTPSAIVEHDRALKEAAALIERLHAQLATARADGRKQGLKIGEEFAMEYTSEKYANEPVKDVAFAIANSISMIAAHGLPEDDMPPPPEER